MNRRKIARLLLFPPLVFLVGCGHSDAPAAKKPPPLPVVQLMPATIQTLTARLPATGTLEALTDHMATVSPSVAGTLDMLAVHYGQMVQKGQVIAHLSTGTLQGQIMQAQAAVGQAQVQVQQAKANALQQQATTQTGISQARSAVSEAEATLAGAKATMTGDEAALRNAQQSLRREKTLYAEGLVAEKDVEAAALAVRTAQAQVSAQSAAVAAQAETVSGQRQVLAASQAAKIQNQVKRQDVLVARQQVRNAAGALATARAQEALYTLRAPLSGQITQVGVSAGETVDTTDKIAVITNLSVLQLHIALPGDEARQVVPGDLATFAVPGLPGRTFHATVGTISSQVDPTTGTVTALALVPNPNRVLQAQETVKVQIITQQRPNALTVPQAAVLTNPQTGKDSVVVVDAQGVAHVRPVTTGLADGGRVQIMSGLTPGRRVAVTGQFGLPDGTKVQVQETPHAS